LNYFRKIRKVAYVKGNSVFQHLLFVISQFLTNQMSNTASESEPKGKMDFDSDFGVDQNKSLRRPWVAFFHFFFRITALVVYLFGSTFSGSFIGVFVTVILLLSLDFWTVKNISGRILVGLRWWNYINDEGVSEWHFESRDGTSNLDSLASNFGGKGRDYYI